MHEISPVWGLIFWERRWLGGDEWRNVGGADLEACCFVDEACVKDGSLQMETWALLLGVGCGIIGIWFCSSVGRAEA